MVAVILWTNDSKKIAKQIKIIVFYSRFYLLICMLGLSHEIPFLSPGGEGGGLDYVWLCIAPYIQTTLETNSDIVSYLRQDVPHSDWPVKSGGWRYLAFSFRFQDVIEM